MNIIDGKAIAEKIQSSVQRRIAESGITPGLAIVLVGDNEASKLYVRLKEQASREVGIRCTTYRFHANTTAPLILDKITTLNQDPEVHGIIVQLPLPRHLPEDAIIAAIDFRKDVDGFHPKNVEGIMRGINVPEPTLIASILRILKETKVKLRGSNVVVLANSPVFIDPFIHLLLKKGAVAKAFRRGERFEQAAQEADIVIAAYGQPHMIKDRMIKDGAVLIDVGVTRMPDGSIQGDVDVESVKEKAGWVSPVPGGVGPVTVATLLEHTLESALVLQHE